MCNLCTEAVRKYFPDVPDEEYGNFLISVTSFPAGDGEEIYKQLRDLRVKTANWETCFAIADMEMNEAIKQLNESKKQEPNHPITRK